MNKLRTLTIVMLALMLPAALFAAEQMIVGDALGDVLLVADVATGELTEYGTSIGTPHIVSLAYDEMSGVTYCSDTSEGVNQVLSIDPNTGATSLVCQVPDFWTILHSLAVDPTTGDLYAIDQHYTILYKVNVGTGELENIGEIGVSWITGADFDPVTGELYICIGGLDDSGALYTVDKTTAEATFVANTHRLMGLAFGCDGDLYGVNNAWYPNPPGLYRIDQTTGDWETLGEFPGRNLMSIECLNLDVVSTSSSTLGGLKSLYR